MLQPQHIGLFFSNEHIQNAHKNRQRAPLKDAWAFLNESRFDGIAGAQLGGLRYRFSDDADAGRNALQKLEQQLQGELAPDAPFFDAVGETVALLQGYDMLHNHPDLTPDRAAPLRESLAARVEVLNQPERSLEPFERAWQSTLNVAAGAVLDWDEPFAAGVDVVKAFVQKHIHPEGHFPAAVEPNDGNGLQRHLLSAAALVLSAEAAALAGENLYTYEARGVGVLTPVPYAVYYFFYPEKWRWDEDHPPLTEEAVKEAYARHAGFFEIALNRDRLLKDLNLILDALRPVYDVYGGGLTTLTHGVPSKRGLFW